MIKINCIVQYVSLLNLFFVVHIPKKICSNPSVPQTGAKTRVLAPFSDSSFYTLYSIPSGISILLPHSP